VDSSCLGGRRDIREIANDRGWMGKADRETRAKSGIWSMLLSSSVANDLISVSQLRHGLPCDKGQEAVREGKRLILGANIGYRIGSTGKEYIVA